MIQPPTWSWDGLKQRGPASSKLFYLNPQFRGFPLRFCGCIKEDRYPQSTESFIFQLLDSAGFRGFDGLAAYRQRFVFALCGWDVSKNCLAAVPPRLPAN